MKYRADIDGLRALSVCAVILFHADVPGFAGGFIGVDVFFVISGYLITQVLSEPHESGRAALYDFYIRRARRILPAMLLVLAVTACVAWRIALPDDLRDFGRALALASAMLANVEGWLFTGYFAAQGAQVSLLHLWSIGVEEQFYIVYPLALFAMRRLWPRRFVAAIALGTAASFALCVYASWFHPQGNFFLMPTRGWELGVGALVALGALRVPESGRAWWACSALGVLCAYVLLYHRGLPWPGLATAPVVAAAAVLVSSSTGGKTGLGRMLALQPLRFTGLISYSLYLWHAPVLTLFEYYHISPPSAAALAGLLIAIYLLSALTWKFLEQPVRQRFVLRSNRRFLVLCALASTTLCALGWSWMRSDGLPTRFSAEVLGIVATDRAYDVSVRRCFLLSNEQLRRGDLCRFGSESPDAPRVLLWGDSHALSSIDAYRELAVEHGVALYFAGHSVCSPLVRAPRIQRFDLRYESCARFNRAMDEALTRIDPQAVLMVAFWRASKSSAIRSRDTLDEAYVAQFRRDLSKTIELIAAPNRRLCFVRDTPQLDFQGTRAVAIAHIRGIGTASFRMADRDAHRQQAPLDDVAREFAGSRGFMLLSPIDALCGGAWCDIERGGVPLYYDSNHLSRAGGRAIKPAIAPCFKNLGHRAPL